jgi:hypothetical protein
MYKEIIADRGASDEKPCLVAVVAATAWPASTDQE